MPRTGSLPIYQQISELIVRDVASGRLADGMKLAPEREMAAELGIAVGTLRKALADLEEKGILERVQGSGNYIRAKADVDSLYAFFRLERPEGGGLPTAEVLSVTRMEKPADLPAFGTSPEAHRIRRLRRLSGEPAAVEEIWLDASYATRITAEELSESLYLYYRRTLGLWVQRAEDRIGLGEVPDWAPAAFGPRPGAAAPVIERQSRAQDGRVAEVSRSWFDWEKARYVARLK
ncbi:GntR family transcriptional regulator [Solirhodobacter olei]|uniref:GntR family transcriptional regulator n=1 Tax=Solirhodobacter olei TaxID=2493082 RepID=UPI000FDA7B90|nr:GntR family transcriptional regulator [Solirhodobacter olei]